MDQEGNEQEEDNEQEEEENKQEEDNEQEEEDNEQEDISWFEKMERLHNMDHICPREPMNEITIHFVYVNLDNAIHKIITENYELQTLEDDDNKKDNNDDNKKDSDKEESSFLDNIRFISHIQHKKQSDNIRYKLFDIVLYHIGIESANLQKNDKIQGKFYRLSLLEKDISIPPSVFIFHSLNAIYVWLKEDVHNTPSKIVQIQANDSVCSNIIDISDSHAKTYKYKHHLNKRKRTRKNTKIYNTNTNKKD